MMDLGMAQGGGDAEGVGMPPEQDAMVTIEKLPEGGYRVIKANHEAVMEGEEADGQTFDDPMEACQAAISMLDGSGNADAEIMDGYNGPSKQMQKVGVKEVFGG